MDTIRYQLKMLNQQCGLYTKTKTMMKNNLIALLDQTYPGVNALFDSPVREDGTQKWVDFAVSFWHVDCVQGMSPTAFVQRYAKWCKQHRYQARAGRAEMLKLASQLPEFPVVVAMRGVGDTLGPQLMVEIGDVTRFTHHSAITSFAGVDPGAYQAKSVHTSRSGSPELRKALFLVMDCLIQTKPQDDPIYLFMDKKHAEGKPYLDGVYTRGRDCDRMELS